MSFWRAFFMWLPNGAPPCSVASFRVSENTDKAEGYITKSRRDLQGRLYRYD